MTGSRNCWPCRASPNEHEATLAGAKAEELLRRYNLDVGVAENPDDQTAEKRLSESLGARVSPYKYTLANAANRQFDVEHYITHCRAHSGYEKHLVFLGLAANVEAAVMTHSYWCATVDALYSSAKREAGESPRLSPSDYKRGVAERIAARVSEMKRQAAFDPSTRALIRIGSAVARRALEAEEIFFGSGFRVAELRDFTAYRRGYADGARVDLFGARTRRMLAEPRN